MIDITKLRVTKLDKIKIERIRGATKLGEITKNVQERRVKWYGHVMRRVLRRKEGDGNESTGEKEERKTERMVGQSKG